MSGSFIHAGGANIGYAVVPLQLQRRFALRFCFFVLAVLVGPMSLLTPAHSYEMPYDPRFMAATGVADRIADS